MAHAGFMPFAVLVALLGFSMIHSDRDVEKDTEGVQVDVHSFQKLRKHNLTRRQNMSKLVARKLNMTGSTEKPKECAIRTYDRMPTLQRVGPFANGEAGFTKDEWEKVRLALDTNNNHAVDVEEWKGLLVPDNTVCDLADVMSTFYAMDEGDEEHGPQGIDQAEWAKAFDRMDEATRDEAANGLIDKQEFQWFFFVSGIAGELAMLFKEKAKAQYLENLAMAVGEKGRGGVDIPEAHVVD